MEKTANNIIIRRADWSRDQPIISNIRRQVFIEEQHVPEELEWDGLDTGAIHILAGPAAAIPCATGRLLQTGQIGRMAVLPGYRGQGLGGLVLAELLNIAANSGMQEVFLHAQASAIPFYRRHGFRAAGDPFTEAGIAHQLMRRLSIQPGSEPDKPDRV